MKKLTFSWIGSPQQLVRVLLGCIILSGSLVFSSGAFALTLEQAKQQGRVGETLSGYLAPVKKDAETLALVEQINIARAEKYQEVAQKNHISTEDVAKLAGQKLVNRAAAGEYVRGINGQWIQR
ncbi:TPA: YdbL family protein [Yersinia enterocolitica]|uniref:YdbL family protein n=1 Tax=Yersinia enterocolitica TaxID=630 RepID=UPI00094B991D|nr:YdbL family protein [Yersinia enterocolitica]MBW5832135.1 YdbL family protein [Yersinia enterocolitica]MBX9476256.1 YdbL family protein [Yersinia enterocolitica]MBX9486751.1 YdbL family protein [Yersinia enterocolitica]MBX9492616.1 YdbL family protein [Yersinia enterocolitica]HEI6849335.1 YdbL family protein [Yersinia enterocolitica]